MDDEKQPEPLTTDRALEILEYGEIATEHGLIRWSSNYTFLVSITHNDDTVRAIYKPQRGERPLWDFPDGTLCYRERASFVTAQTLGWDLVPPTVLRSGPRGIGTFQLYIDHDPEYHYFSFDPSLKPQLARMALFDCLVNNADRKGGHCLVDSDNRLWGIDQGLTFNTAHKLRTVIWDFAGQSIAASLLTDVETLCEQVDDENSAYRQQLCALLAPPEIAAFQQRVRRLLRSGRYPKPGPGPNYPWPPV